jgi:hypothetical protein
MKTFLRITIAFTILLFVCNAWAQNRQECPTLEIIPGVYLPLPPDSPGACFWSPDPGSIGAWTIFFMYDGENLVLVFSLGLGDNNFTRFNPQGKGSIHLNDKDGVTAYLCSQDLDTCISDYSANGLFGELADFWFIGPGNLVVNGGSNGGTLECPWEVRFKGTVANGAGHEVKLQAFTTYVIDHTPDSNDLIPGCREAMTKISINPID